MIENKNNFSVIKKHENSIHSSVNGNMIELLQLCQNNVTQEHFYTYEVLDSKGNMIGGRLHYQFDSSEQALEQWDSFTSSEGLASNIKVSITKEFVTPVKKLKY
jgi:hypothetical protein